MYINYHSFTNWIFDPLYVVYAGDIYINKVVFDRVMERAEDKLSTYDIQKASILEVYVEKKVVHVVDYKKLFRNSDIANINNIITNIISKEKDLLKTGIIQSYEIWIEYQRNILKRLYPNEPYFNILKNRIKIWKKHLNCIKRNGISKKDIENIGKRCIEDIFYSSYISSITGNEILEWEQYILWYKLLYSKIFHSRYSLAKDFIERHVIDRLIEIVIEQNTPSIILKNIDEFFILKNDLKKLKNKIEKIKDIIYKKWIPLSEIGGNEDYLLKELAEIIDYEIKPLVNEIKVIEIKKKHLSKKIRNYSVYSTILSMPMVLVNPAVGGILTLAIPIVGAFSEELAEIILKNSPTASWYLNFKSITEKIYRENTPFLDINFNINELNKNPNIEWWDSSYVK